MKRLLNKLRCLLFGHPCVATGRHGYVLHEWHCTRCGNTFISHIEYGNTLVSADEESDRIFRRQERIDRQASN